MTLDEAIRYYGSREPNTNHVVPLCAAAGGELVDALNAVALRIARLYLDGSLAFAGADSIANSLFGYVTSQTALRPIPEPMCGIFHAFDAGEFRRPSDPPDVDPAVKYSVPLLREILEVHAAR